MSDWLITIIALITLLGAEFAVDTARAADFGQRWSVAAGPNRALKRAERYTWYELTDAQDARLRDALKTIQLDRPVLILSATADSLALAEDFDTAFSDAGIKSSVDRPMDVVDGLHVTSQELALLVAVVGIRAVVDPDDDADHYVMNFGRKVRAP